MATETSWRDDPVPGPTDPAYREPVEIGKGVTAALGAALVFGAATPFAKRFGAGVDPQVFAGLLYLGSGLVLSATLMLRPPGGREAGLRRADRVPLGLSVVFGGMIAPLLLMIGLRSTPAATASLLVNLESVFTALGAWFILKEHADRRIVIGMIVIVAASVLLSFEPGGRFSLNVGSMAIAAACLCWGVDNVATRPLALRDPRQIACVKGLAAGSANVAIGLAWGGHLPGRTRLAAAFVVGFLGYGLSLILYIRAMRWLGAARTAAYYSAAPFAGSAIALIWLRERVGPLYWPALVLMVIGLAVHLTEDHRHRHRHEPILHAHRHDHLDGHHRHGQTGAREDAGEHVHEPTVHDHNHTPDDHHRHDHPARADRPGRADHPGRADDGDG